VDQIVVEKVPARADSQWAYDNDTTYIDGGNIYTGTLNADRIEAGTITTDRLIGAAVTTSGSAFAASVKAPDEDTAIVCQVTFTTIGGPVIIIAHSTVTTPESYAIGSMDIRMDYTTPLVEETGLRPMDEYEISGTTYSAVKERVTFVYRHVPSAGSHTWKLRLHSGSTADIYAKNSGLVVMELKR
jgi:hypothetical protein